MNESGRGKRHPWAPFYRGKYVTVAHDAWAIPGKCGHVARGMRCDRWERAEDPIHGDRGGTRSDGSCKTVMITKGRGLRQRLRQQGVQAVALSGLAG